ncbi:c-type cytochrome [Sulfitobacter aestuariivivens]|uniref:C-type cytochrome n=1 Tax=Sulfitobacter aestuariivivens TaxID=2766981 RepID=A0A927HID8_9RHOB|nr:c-type cytochrome [Sulfitobacter aestuariivivens]MBD3666160.1 c-type cytochrome [Sulfitobacter aestuariivivens]
MSKSPNLLIPALGGTAIVLGAAYGLSQRGHGADQIEILEGRVAQVEAQASTARQKAETQAARAAELELQIADVQAAATKRAAMPASLTTTAPEPDGGFGLGRAALPEEIAAWDVDVLPDGRGLPEGTGNAFDGEEVFAQKCASCHGDFAEGVDNWPVLAGGFDTLGDKDPVKTVGSYWPHLSTVWDYVHRSMPFGEAGTLTPDETYAIVAYILYSNDLIDDEFELTHENLGTFEMYNRDGFVIDDRSDAEYTEWRADPCMENCKDTVEVTMRSVFLVETPAEGGTESTMNNATADGLPSFTAEGPSFIPAAIPKVEQEESSTDQTEATPAVQQADDGDDTSQLVVAGEKVFRKCKACHQIGEGAKNRSGPQLNAVFGRVMGSVDGFKYSDAFKAAQEEGRVWDDPAMAEFLARPKGFMKGTKMAFPGLKKEADIKAVAAYIKTFGE